MKTLINKAAALVTGTVLFAFGCVMAGLGLVVMTVLALFALPEAFTGIYAHTIFGLPVAAYYVLAIAIVLWVVSEYLPIGRNLYAIGANSRAAELNGIRRRR